ncbi:MAG: molybdopterin-dependent oxidoreductase [Planctomycetota bacterium]
MRTTCTRDCPDTCEILATVANGRIVGHAGAADNPVTRGYLCYKGRTFLKHQYHPDRIIHPLRRTSDGWERVSWEEALDLAAGHLARCRQRGGPLSVLYCTYSGLREIVKRSLSRRFFAAFGGATLVKGGLCTELIDAAHELDMGKPGAHDLRDVANARAVVIWGRNPAVTHVHQMPFIREARAAGAPVVVIDPLPTITARGADLHLKLRPGSDGFLALGVARAILDRDAAGKEPVDGKFLERCTRGYEDYRRLVMRTSVAEAAAACDLEVRQLEALADIYATRKPAATFLGLGVCYYRQSLANIRLVDALVALTGNLGVPGGGVGGDADRTAGLDRALTDWPPLETRSLRVAVLGQDLRQASEPTIAMAWIAGADPVASSPDSRNIAQALESLPFVMVVDQFMTATAQRAHLFLPCTTYLEETDLATSYGHDLVSQVVPAAPPLGECRSDTEIFRLLAERLGFGAALDGPLEAWMRQAIAPLAKEGVTLEALREGARCRASLTPVPFAGGQFATPSGRFEFITAHEPRVDPAEPPFLRLMSTKAVRMLNLQCLPEDLPEEPSVCVHPNAVAGQGLEDGAKVWVSSPAGRIRARLRLDRALREDLALIHPARWRGELVGVNQLRETTLTEEGWGGAMHETRVRLSRA